MLNIYTKVGQYFTVTDTRTNSEWCISVVKVAPDQCLLKIKTPDGGTIHEIGVYGKFIHIVPKYITIVPQKKQGKDRIKVSVIANYRRFHVLRSDAKKKTPDSGRTPNDETNTTASF